VEEATEQYIIRELIGYSKDGDSKADKQAENWLPLLRKGDLEDVLIEVDVPPRQSERAPAGVMGGFVDLSNLGNGIKWIKCQMYVS